MQVLSIQNVALLSKAVGPCDFESQPLAAISYTFTFGKTYLLDGWPWDGGGTLSWIIGGAIEPQYGTILMNDQPYPLPQRRNEAWLVRSSTIKSSPFQFRKLTV